MSETNPTPLAPAPPIGGLWADLRGTIQHRIDAHPRSLQKRIGPSEIGAPCDHCLAAKVAGWERNVAQPGWLATIGTAVHEWLEATFGQAEIDLNKRGLHRYRMEARVTVGQVAGADITGSTDLLDESARTTVDWKIVGDATLRKIRSSGQPSPVYRAQADLYAKGWNDAGVPVEHVSIAFLPRNKPSLASAVFWHAPHERARAEGALERVERLATTIGALAPLGEDAVAGWIGGLPRDPDCYDCARYPDAPLRGSFSELLPAG